MARRMAAIGVVAGVVLASFAAPANSETVGEFYQRRPMTMIISSGGGGSYTLIYQTIARFMPRRRGIDEGVAGDARHR